MIDVHAVATGAVAAVGLGLGIAGIGWFLPGFLVKKLHAGFEAAKSSPWWRDANHPKRAQWLLATAVLLEDEIPEPGKGRELYEAIGQRLAGLSPFLIGTGTKWANALEKVGDALDTALDDEIKTIGAAQAQKPS